MTTPFRDRGTAADHFIGPCHNDDRNVAAAPLLFSINQFRKQREVLGCADSTLYNQSAGTTHLVIDTSGYFATN